MAKFTQYDPGIIQKYADKLYSQAASIVFTMTILGLLVGAGIGYGFTSAIALPIDENSKLIYAAVGAVICSLVGYAMGIALAFKLKFKAQIALCQKTIEENTQRKA